MKWRITLIFLLTLLAGCSQNVHVRNQCSYSGIDVYFYFSPTCPHCEHVKPYIDRLRENYGNVTFHYCNIRDLPEECYNYTYYVIGVPTVVVHTKNVTTALVGERDVMKLEELIKRLACCEG